ncbi:hypothetical protein [uncultured Bacteroides sp.]|uniref:hypothetical protein n=1 Tax=uncultured Bacteroides sp. TaxID=162156 RepID=UPI002599493C|nr:hypothetical protein [uncultured Bacteroides sp.]
MAVNGCSLYPQGGKVETVGGVIDTPTGTVSLRVGIALIQVLSPSLSIRHFLSCGNSVAEVGAYKRAMAKKTRLPAVKPGQTL